MAATRALCGHASEPCCGPPLRDCAPAHTCNPATQLCEALPADLASAPTRLCRAAADCGAGETCCSAGYVSTCQRLESSAECPRPDLTLDFDPQVPITVEAREVVPTDCELRCAGGPGRHRVLVFEPRVINRGAADVLFGAPGTPGVQISPALPRGDLDDFGLACSAYSYVEQFVRWELLGSDGSSYASADAQFHPGCDSPFADQFGCDFLRASVGIFYFDFGCRGLLLDGVPEGEYTLRATVDPDDRIAESNETNNVVEARVTVGPVDPLRPCDPTLDPPDLTRDCGWTPALSAACTPGAAISIGCPTCQGDPMLRVCPGSKACDNTQVLASGDDDDASCPPVATFACPAEGAYSSFVAPYGEGIDPWTCSVTRVPAAAGP